MGYAKTSYIAEFHSQIQVIAIRLDVECGTLRMILQGYSSFGSAADLHRERSNELFGFAGRCVLGITALGHCAILTKMSYSVFSVLDRVLDKIEKNTNSLLGWPLY